VHNIRVAVRQRSLKAQVGTVQVGNFAYNEVSNFRSCQKIVGSGRVNTDAPFFMP